MITISKGWKIFFETCNNPDSRSTLAAAEHMYRLNVFARSIGRHPIREQIYVLKNGLIKYLYLHKYSYEVKQHVQKRVCFACGGSGEYWTGEDCYRCHGTGIYSKIELYAFRFEIAGKRFAWHQLQHLVNYKITLTDSEPSDFTEPTTRDAAILSLEEAYRACNILWWFLFFHGQFNQLLLFEATRNWVIVKSRMPHILEWLHTKRVWTRNKIRKLFSHRKPVFPDWEDDVPF